MISVVLPIETSVDGFDSFTDEEKSEAIKQNFKFLLLTRPGEYVMLPDFGVGLPNYLFHLDTTFPVDEVEGRIRAQAAEFLPYVEIKKIEFNLENIDSNGLGIHLEYSIMESALNEQLNLFVTI